MLDGTSGTKLTAAVSCAVPLVAVMCAVPASVALMSDVAMPLVVGRGELALPRSVVNVTDVPFATSLPNRSVTVAVNTLLTPTT